MIPNLKIVIPKDRTFWKALAVTAQLEIRRRTTSGRDVDERAFKPYSRKTLEYRLSKGRSARPNLTFTGRMLGGMQPTGLRDRGKIRFSGREGDKARANEGRGRLFFGVSRKQQQAILKQITEWVIKKNKGVSL